MSSTANVVLVILLLILPLSALLSRRVRPAQVVKMALAWVLIFAAGLVLVSGRSRFQSWWDGGRHLLFGQDQTMTGDTVRIEMSDDGHFYAQATLNGVDTRMLIDSGATATALSKATARRAGITGDGVFPAMLQTANGPVSAERGTIEELKIGSITTRELPVVISPAFGDLDVIGMNLLSRLRSWRVEGRTLILEPPGN